MPEVEPFHCAVLEGREKSLFLYTCSECMQPLESTEEGWKHPPLFCENCEEEGEVYLFQINKDVLLCAKCWDEAFAADPYLPEDLPTVEVKPVV